MHTKTLIEALAQIKSKDNAVRFKMLQEIFAVYDIKFTRLNVLTHFRDFPAPFVWADENGANTSFRYGKTLFKPNTLADFISIVESLGFDLYPRFADSPSTASVIFWNNNRGVK